MLSGVCVEPGRFSLIERDLPVTAPPGWVLVDLAAAGICGTDYHIFEGKHPYLEYPRVIGHELSGYVAVDADGWIKGQLVVINPYIACGKCRACLRGKPNCCMAIGVLGVHRDGGMCERIAVPAGNLYDASALSVRDAALVEFLAIGAHAVRRSEATSGDRVLVTGAGPIGLGTALFARLAGAEVHLMDMSAERLEAAKAFGFSRLHMPDRPLLEGELADGFDVVFDATGSPKAMEAGFGHVAHGGTYVFVSVVKGDLTFSDAEFHKREMKLVGSRNAQTPDFLHVMDALSSGDIDGGKLVSTVLALEELPEKLPALAADRSSLIKVLVALPAWKLGHG
ncbi:zinc-binding alcohol dehydrogenase family protein [Rhizobium sp. LjRoot254]|uniref:zinc-binding alcohol dehydrogenase family protein n=1 Tax=Rhizobium sp. LjRoot254 TaxID=3342297 RepID=UPI003ECC8E34